MIVIFKIIAQLKCMPYILQNMQNLSTNISASKPGPAIPLSITFDGAYAQKDVLLRKFKKSFQFLERNILSN